MSGSIFCKIGVRILPPKKKFDHWTVVLVQGKHHVVSGWHPTRKVARVHAKLLRKAVIAK